MGRGPGPAKEDNPWPRMAWWSTAMIVAVSVVLGFVVISRYQQNGQPLDAWGAICRAIGITADDGPAAAPQPPLRSPTRIAWTSGTLRRIANGAPQNGAFIALNCGACHGEQGVSSTNLIPTLAGMDSRVIYKQLDDYRSGKRLWGAMTAIADALNLQDSADVAAYFARLTGGLAPVSGEGAPSGGRRLRQTNTAVRLIFAGDPGRGIPACAACHGPGGHELGAPALEGQHAAYIERQLAAFAQGMRQNDINEQMRTIAEQLTPEEMQTIADIYARRGGPRLAQR